MEHRWGSRLVSRIPVRLKCEQSPDNGCRCLGCLESLSASGALVRTERGICPSAHITIEPLTPALGLKGRELPANLVRVRSGEIAIEWAEFPSSAVLGLMTETLLTSGSAKSEYEMPTLGRIRFCALAP